MQVVRPIVCCQSQLSSIQSEFAVGDAIAIATNGGPEIGMALQVTVQCGEALSDVRQPAIAVRDLERYHDRAIIDHLEDQAVGVCARVHRDGLAVGCLAKFSSFDFHGSLFSSVSGCARQRHGT